MIILIHGEDTFRAQEKVKQLEKAFKDKFDPTGLNTAHFPAEGKKLDPGEIFQSICAAPFMSEKRMVIIKGFIEGLEKTPESTIVIVWDQKEQKAKQLKDLGDVHQYPFPFLQGNELQQWALHKIKKHSGQIDQQALNTLIERVGSDLWQMDHEIKKITAFSNKDLITKDIVENMVRPSFEGEIFALIDAVSRKQTTQAMKLLEQERLSGSDDHYLFSMLARQIRILLAARDLLDQNPRATKQDLADQMGLHPFVAQKALQQAQAFTFENLKKTHQLLFDFDWKMKSGQIKTGLAVDLITADLVK